MKNIFNKVLLCLMIIVVLMNSCGGIIAHAFELDNADMVAIGSVDYHLKYYREDTCTYRYLICTIVGYYNNGVFYPGYCMNRDLPGITDERNYSVNISSIVNRDDVWRVVKNGYPYKSPEEMGVANEFDAFAVTKFAVYCITGQAELDYFCAEDDDEEALNMLNALHRLVEIGINGSETRTNGNFTVSKVGEVKEEGEFCYQEYKINSNIETKEIGISIINNFPEGSFLKYVSNEKFRLYVPINKIDGNVKGKIKISGKSRSYPIFYGESGDSGTQDYLLTYDTFGNFTSDCDIDISYELKKGQVKVIKVDKDNNEVKLKGVKFEVLDEKENVLETLITDEKGEAVTKKYAIKDYNKLYIKEIKTDEKYKLNNKKKVVELKENDISEIVFENELKKGKIKVIKVDKDNNEVKLEGVKFEVINSLGEVVETLITNEEGEAETTELPIYEEYKIREIDTLNDYILSEDEITIKLEENEIKNITFENEKIKNRFKIIKVDKDDNTQRLSGVKFEVLDEESNVLEILETDKNGEAFSSYYPINKVYTIHEIGNIDGYRKLDEYISFILEKEKLFEIKVENKKEEVPPEETDEPEVPEKPKIPEEPKQEEKIETPKIENVPEEKEPTASEIKVLPRTGY